MLPAVGASFCVHPTTVPQEPVDVGNVMAEALLVDAGALPAAAFHVALEVATRAYEPVETSVPPVPASLGSVVHRPMYAVGIVQDVLPTE